MATIPNVVSCGFMLLLSFVGLSQQRTVSREKSSFLMLQPRIEQWRLFRPPALLADLQVPEGQLQPPFSSNNFSYTVIVPKDVEDIHVTAKVALGKNTDKFRVLITASDFEAEMYGSTMVLRRNASTLHVQVHVLSHKLKTSTYLLKIVSEGYAALARLSTGITNGNGAENTQAGADMFGDDDESEQRVGLSNQSSGIAAAPVRKVNGKEQNMFGGDDQETSPVRASDNGNAAEQVGAPGSEGAASVDGSGHVYDELSGYYCNSELGYYYDANSGMYCCASTGLWYRFDEDTNSYLEVTQ